MAQCLHGAGTGDFQDGNDKISCCSLCGDVRVRVVDYFKPPPPPPKNPPPEKK